MAIPTRTEIQAKINEIRQDPAFSTIQSDLIARIDAWLGSLSCPADDKEKILTDLTSYQGV